MRYLTSISIAILLVILLAGCKKEKDTTPTEDGPGTLIGTWELSKSWGGMSPLTTYAPGNGHELVFDSLTYKMIQKGNLIAEGAYHLVNDAYIDVNNCSVVPPKDDQPNHIVYQNDPAGFKRYFEVSSQTLRISTSCIPVDGGVSEYKRKSALPQGN